MTELEAYKTLSATLIYMLFRSGFTKEESMAVTFAKNIYPSGSGSPYEHINAASQVLWNEDIVLGPAEFLAKLNGA